MDSAYLHEYGKPLETSDCRAYDSHDGEPHEELTCQSFAVAATVVVDEPEFTWRRAALPSHLLQADGGGEVVEDDFLGDRFWGQVQGSSGRLKALRERGADAEELAVLQGNRMSKRCSLAV